MIDTIALIIDESQFEVVKPELFNPTYFKGYSSGIVFKQYPTSTELKAGLYKPRLSLSRRFNGNRQYRISLKVEFSVSKLLYLNNFDEVENKDLFEIATVLLLRLREMGIITTLDALIQAPVSVIHYSKNIPLLDYSTPYSFMKAVEQANITNKLDLNQSDFKNGGHCLKYHSDSYEIVFYDKLMDLQRSRLGKNRSEERNSLIQQHLLTNKAVLKPFEVLRMEVRINTRKKLKSILNKLQIQSDYTFESLFQYQISKKVLLFYCNLIKDNSPTLLQYGVLDHKDMLIQLRLNNPELSLNKALQLVGLKAILDDTGVREFRTIIRGFDKNSWTRLSNTLSNLNISGISPHPLERLQTELSRFKPLKLIDFL